MSLSLGIVGFLVVLGVVLVLFTLKAYKVCSSDEILVKTGKLFGTKNGEVAQVTHGGATFVIPFIQQYRKLPVSPFTIDVNLKAALTKENIRVDLPSNFNLRISVDPDIMKNAARSLISLSAEAIRTQAFEIIIGQFRAVVANMTINQINQDREAFINEVERNVNTELNKIGIEIVNVNITDIKDEAGYLAALGKKAASEAVQKAQVDVANAEKNGSIGVNEAEKEKQIEVTKRLKDKEVEVNKLQAIKSRELAEAEAERRKQIALIEADTLEKENLAKAKQLEANAMLSEKQAEAAKRKEVANADAARDILNAQREAERAKLEKETITTQEIEKRKAELIAEQEANVIMCLAKAKADALLLEKEAEAKAILIGKEAEAAGLAKVLNAQAEGYQNLFKTVGEHKHLVPTMELVKIMPSLVEAQAKAISNIKFDKVTVWDGGNANSTSNFLKNVVQTLPPLQEFAKQAGVQLPSFMGSMLEDTQSVTKVDKQPE